MNKSACIKPIRSFPPSTFHSQLFSRFQFSIFLFQLLCLSSCQIDVTDEIDVPNQNPLLVIEGGIERNLSANNTTHTVRLSLTQAYLSEEPEPPVTDAVVTVTDGSNSWEMSHTQNGLYVTDNLWPQINTDYTLEIKWRGDTYRGTDRLNEVPRIDSLYAVYKEDMLITDEGYFLMLDSQDPPGVKNYYYYKVYRNGVFTIVPDPGNVRTLVLSDEFFDGRKRIAVEPNEEVIFAIGDTGTAEQIGLSEPYFRYLYQMFDITGNQGLSFIGNPPPASIRSNILNITNSKQKALGFFYAVDIDSKTTVITE